LRKQKGMFLPGILITTVVATMFIGAALSLAPTGFLRAQQSTNQDAAERAAQAGIEYALARLSIEPRWKGDAPSDIASGPDLFVHEDKGNVVGLLQTSDGLSRFRIRFNLQNGHPGHDMDGFDNPAAAMSMDFPLVSYNNLFGPNETIPADPGQGRPDSQAVKNHSIYFAVEGAAGRGLSKLTQAAPNASLDGGYSTKILRCVYQGAQSTPNVRDAVTMAANAFKATMPSNSNSKLDLSGDGTPRIRSKVSLVVDGNANTSKNFSSSAQSEFWIPNGATGSANFGTNSHVSRKDENVAQDGFYQIKWEDVPQASGTAPRIAAGTYVFAADSNGNGTLRYYNVAPKDYPAYIDAHPTDPGTAPANSPVTTWPIPLTQAGTDLVPGVKASFGGGKGHFDISNDLVVEAGANSIQDFGVIPQKGAPAAPVGDPNGDNSANVDLLHAQQYTSLNNFLNSTDQTSFTVPHEIAQVVLINLRNMTGVNTVGDEYHLTFGVSHYDTSLGGSGQFNNLPVNSPYRALLQSALGTPASPQTAGIKDTPLDPEDIEITLNPAQSGQNLVLSSPGSLLFGAQVDGTSSSIVSAGDVKVIGAGTSFQAPKKNQGLSLYAKGDVTLSSYNPENTAKSKGKRYNNVSLSGIVYTWGNFKAILGSQTLTNKDDWGSFDLKGTLVAYGGDPASAPGSNGKGRVDIVADGADLKFDASYLVNLIETPNMKFKRAWWSAR
jgi:hypothetical protein